MISFIKGTLAAKDNTRIVVEAGAIGYEVLMPLSALSDIGSVGQQVRVYTYLYVRENEVTLYGFSSTAQRDLFLKLIEVNSVGPKVALSALSTLSTDALIAAIVTEDYALIASIPGVGKKTAQRISLDLKDKFSASSGVASGVISMDEGAKTALGEARLALESMGFSPLEVAQALKESGADDDDPAKIITAALKRLA